MKILVIGNGGREHALLDKLHRDDPAAELFITRGNGGTAPLATALPLDPGDAAALAVWCDTNAVDLTLVGPEAPLADGIVDVFGRRGLAIFGPSRAAANIEASKAWAKALMADAGVPTARFAAFTEADAAAAYIREHGAPIVVKASGLAAGKGAVVCADVDEAVDTATAMLTGERFGGAGREVVIEECLVGDELSIFALCDGRDAILMIAAQDHKRLLDGDAGPNTGGMGAYAPVSIASAALEQQVLDTIVRPTLDAMAADDRPFRGLLFCGVMLTADGPQVIEFNARFGDPETQAVLPLLETRLVDVLLPIARGASIAGGHLDWLPGAAVTTVLAVHGYPDTPRRGDVITIPPALGQDAALRIFHAGTARTDSGALVTAGGRVLAVTALAPTFEDAAARSRAAAARITFDGRHFRGDIGWRERARLQPPTP